MRIAAKLRGVSLLEYEKLDKNRVQSALLDGREMVVEAARMFQNSQEGRVYAALGDAQAIASELGFTLVLYDGLSSAESPDECRKGLDELRKQGMSTSLPLCLSTRVRSTVLPRECPERVAT